jgi:asparagine synthase (glutamine-hydrolysing)
MSGVLGLVNWTGAPADVRLLERMAEAAAHRSPDGRSFWRDGKVGLGHLALHLAPESSAESQPLVQDGLALVADARIDNRSELIPLLRGKRELRTESPSDAEVILAAYRSWGTECAVHLEGDYSFGIWDSSEERLFGARDPMGMRPLYYREEPGRFLFASEAKQILALPDVSRRVREPALLAHIAGPYGRPEWSFFRGIKQLAPGCALTATRAGARVRQFWEVDPEARIRYRRDADYWEHFRDLFRMAVSCRLRTRRPVGLMLSGGVDSGSIASMVGWLLERDEVALPGFRAYCWAFSELRDGDERAISDVILDRYGLSHTNVPGDDAWPLHGYPDHGPDADDPHLWVYQELNDRCLDRAREEGMGVVLTGDRGDEVVGDWVYDFPGLFLAPRWRLLRRELQELNGSLWSGFKRVLRPLLRRGPVPHGTRRPMAPWVPPEAAVHWGLKDLILEPAPGSQFDDAARGLRYGRIFSFTGMRIALSNERRRAARGLGFADPWSDARIARFVLAIPQWRVNLISERKRLARQAMKGIMPEEVRMKVGKTIPRSL